MDVDEEDSIDNDTTSVEGSTENPIPGTADLSILDATPGITDDRKTRDRSNTVTASDEGTSSPLLTPTEPLPSTRLSDPDPTPKVDKEFTDTQENPRTFGEQRSFDDESQISASPERTPAPPVVPLPADTQVGVVSV